MQAVVANQNLTPNVSESAEKLRFLFYQLVPIQSINPFAGVAEHFLKKPPAVIQREIEAKAKIDLEVKKTLAPFLGDEAQLNRLRAEYIKQSTVTISARVFDVILSTSDYHRSHPSTLDKDFSKFLAKPNSSGRPSN